MQGIGTVIVSALIGALVSFVGSLLTYFLGARTRIDEDLRQRRAEVYKALWNLTRLTPMWPRSQDVTYEQLLDLSHKLQNGYFTQGGFYFTQGGFYLSESSKAAYDALQRELNEVVAAERQTHPQLTRELEDQDYETIQVKGSAMRTELTEDLISRSRTFLMR